MKLTLKILGWICKAVICAFLILLLLTNLDPWVFEVPFYLGVGWIFYLRRIFHEIAWNWQAIASGLVFLVLSVGGFHLVARSIASSRGQTWRWGWSARISCLLLLVFGVSLAIGGITHQAAWLARGDKLIGRDSGRVIEEVNKVRNLTQAVKLFAADNGGRYPVMLEELIIAGKWDDLASLEKYMWYIGSQGPPAQWIYVRGLSESAPGDLPLLIAPGTFSGERRIIALNDGSVELMKTSLLRENSLPTWKREYAELGIPLPVVLEQYEREAPASAKRKNEKAAQAH